jgi:hypothetical protein
MKFYYINSASENGDAYTTTIADARRVAREEAADSYDDVTVELVDIATDRANILRMANGQGGFQQSIKIAFTAKAGKTRKSVPPSTITREELDAAQAKIDARKPKRGP